MRLVGYAKMPQRCKGQGGEHILFENKVTVFTPCDKDVRACDPGDLERREKYSARYWADPLRLAFRFASGEILEQGDSTSAIRLLRHFLRFVYQPLQYICC